MPRIKLILVAQTDADTGLLGLVIEGMRGAMGEVNSATEGLLIAHDVIEHVNGIDRIGSIDDELEALGAIWYVRGRHGELNRNGSGSVYSLEENVASDVTRMYRDHICGDAYINYNVGRMPRKVEDDNALHDILSAAHRTYLGEFDDSDGSRYLAKASWDKYSMLALARMRVGYRKARQRWERHGRHAANNAFWAIAEAVEYAAKHPEFEGMRYVLRYNSATGDASCTEQYEE